MRSCRNAIDMQRHSEDEEVFQSGQHLPVDSSLPSGLPHTRPPLTCGGDVCCTCCPLPGLPCPPTGRASAGRTGFACGSGGACRNCVGFASDSGGRSRSCSGFASMTFTGAAAGSSFSSCSRFGACGCRPSAAFAESQTLCLLAVERVAGCRSWRSSVTGSA